MKLGYALLAAFSLTWTASGATVTYNDFKYYGNSPSPTAKGSDFGNEDVFGYLKSFDIEKVTIETTGTTVTIDLFFNYGQNGGDTSLGDYASSSFPTVYPGDVVMNILGVWYVIPLIDHNATVRTAGTGLLANHLYTTDSVLSAQQVTGQEPDPTTRYRPSAIVWGNPTGAVDMGTVATRTISGPIGTSEIHVNLVLSDATLATLINDNLSTFFFNFASATCGNDVLIGIGQFDEVPEPATTALIGGGLLALALLRRR
ncbi:MAG: PEP-CTERM sorting domain-containing protein [Acidobacteria bacterium]|nr:PEP-CTERM sorting domain-containing protein [Acidobacteriota bacterium]